MVASIQTLLLVATIVGSTWALPQVNLKCPPGFFPCDDLSQCVSNKQRCDLVPDCPDGSDEPPNCEFSEKANELEAYRQGCDLEFHFLCKLTKKCLLKR
jgi:hypothetical protein